MIGNLYTSGRTSQRIHVKPAVDLYKFAYTVITLLIYYMQQEYITQSIQYQKYSTYEPISIIIQ